MENFILELTTSFKALLRDKSNLIILLLVTQLCFSGYSHIKLKKKIDHRYFNQTRTIEAIYDVDINTYNGEVKARFKHQND